MGKIYRSNTNRLLGGVCGGLSQTISANSSLVRLLFIISILCSKYIIAIYLILYLLMPLEK